MLIRKITRGAFYGLHVQANYQCYGNVNPKKSLAKSLNMNLYPQVNYWNNWRNTFLYLVIFTLQQSVIWWEVNLCEKGSVGPALITRYLQVPFIFICYISLSNSRRHSANVDMIADLKSKIIVSRQHFFADVIFLPLQNFKTIKMKPEKNPYDKNIQSKIPIPKQIRAYFALLFIFSKL